MTEAIDKNIEAIGKLILLTQKSKLVWDSRDPSVVPGQSSENIASSVFVCEYNFKKLRIYQRKYKDVSRGLGILGLAGLGSAYANDSKQPEMRWYSEIVLELVDEFGNSIWQFPKEKILRDLLEAVKYRTSGASDVIESLLNEQL